MLDPNNEKNIVQYSDNGYIVFTINNKFYFFLMFKQMPRYVYQGQWKWFTTLMWEKVNTTTLLTPAPETQGLHHLVYIDILNKRQACVEKG